MSATITNGHVWLLSLGFLVLCVGSVVLALIGMIRKECPNCGTLPAKCPECTQHVGDKNE